MNYDPLIFGKDTTERVVAVEHEDGEMIMYIQAENGNIWKKSLNSKYWILSPEQIDKRWVKLKGELHYKYGRQFNTYQEFSKMKYAYGSSRDIFAIYNKQEQGMVNKGVTLFKGMKHNEISVLAFDIETPGIQQDINSKVLIIANTYRDSFGNVTRKLFSYDQYPSQKEMIEDWCKWVREMNPTVMCGHNIYTFDLPYIKHCADFYGAKMILGRDGSEITFNRNPSKFRKDGSQFINYHKCNVYGRHMIDTFFLAIKADIARKYENYKLKYIIDYEGLEKEGRVFYDASTIAKNYTIPEEFKKIKEYAEFDGDDALSLYDLFIPSQFYACQSIPKNFQGFLESASGSQINHLLLRSYIQIGHSIPKASDAVDFEGAISYAKPGIWKHCVRWDVSSLYPSIMRQYKVESKEKDPSGHFQKILEYFAVMRLEHKKLAKETGDRYYKDLEQMEKTTCNSFYGFLGATGLAFNYPEGAAFITSKGRDILKQAIEWASGEKYNVESIETEIQTVIE